MNKAFVKENDANDEAEAPAQAPLPGGNLNYMTKAGNLRLREEFEHLVKVERPALVQVVSWAAGNGDRSENGDYIYGKKRLREIDKRIRYLLKRLENAVVVDPQQQENLDQVFFGATVTIIETDAAGGYAEATYQIVGVDEADASAGCISWISPLARALLKAREGDVVRFQSPAGIREIEIGEIVYR
jgi:transcription elongation factor GreB